MEQWFKDLNNLLKILEWSDKGKCPVCNKKKPDNGDYPLTDGHDIKCALATFIESTEQMIKKAEAVNEIVDKQLK